MNLFQGTKLLPFRIRFDRNAVFDIVIIQIIFWILATKNLSLPGYYMDEAGLDWLAARLISPEIQNPIWIAPQIGPPLIGTLYATYLGTYLELIPLYLFGITLENVRIVHLTVLSFSIILTQLIIRKFTQTRLLCFLLTLGVAISSPLIFGMRSHFYNSAVGIPFLLASVLYLLRERLTNRDILISGLFFGLSFFSYFNFLFFGPLLFFMLKARNFRVQSKESAIFLTGVSIGSIGYLLGYLSLFLKLGSINAGISWIKWASDVIAPINDDRSVIQKTIFGFDLAYKGLSNQGNFLQFFGYAPQSSISKAPVLLMTLLILIALMTRFSQDFQTRKISVEMSMMISPILYLVPISGIFGSRISYQHLMPFFVMFYLSFAISCIVMFRFLILTHRRNLVAKVSSIFLTLMCGLGYSAQYVSIQEELIQTGGLGKSSSALNMMISQANTDKSMGKLTKYYFPEWGFWMPFATLTGNQIPYGIDSINWENVKTEYENKIEIKVYSWSESEAIKIFNAAKDSKVFNGKLRSWKNRDGSVAFYEIHFRF
jgi:hypothetical protein